MDTQKVIVLLSAYNGEKYIEAQVDSILAQSHKKTELYIRDDGSTDNTLKALEKYKNDPRVHVLVGENIGFIKSFFELIRQSGDAAYYAFADQDDVWLPTKIEMALELLNKENEEQPLLYFSGYDFCNENMEFQEHSGKPAREPSFENALVDCMTLGFNSVFNKRACELMRQHIPENSCGHDWWTYMVCAGMGKVIFDERVTVCYRRHGNNVSAGGMNFWKFQIWRFKKFFLNDYFANVHKQIKEYADLYNTDLNDHQQKFLALFYEDRYRVLTVLKKTLYPHRLRNTFVDEMMLRFVFLIGKL